MGTGLSEVAEHLGRTLPAASELVNRLVRQGLLTRATDERERRRICLDLTPGGAGALDAARERTLDWLREVVAGMPGGTAAALVEGLSALGERVDRPGPEPSSRVSALSAPAAAHGQLEDPQGDGGPE